MPSQHRAPDNRDGGADYREGGDRARERSRSSPFDARRAELMAMGVANRSEQAAARCERAAAQAAARCEAAAAQIGRSLMRAQKTLIRAEEAATQARLAANPKAPWIAMELPRMEGSQRA